MNIHKISIQVTSGGFNLVTIEEFLKFSPVERTDLILKKRISFLNEKGEVISLTQGLKELVQLAKLRMSA